MSLVSEALRKARQEAAEKGAQQRGVVFRTTVVLGPKGTRFSVGWLAVLVVAVAVLAGAGIAWWTLSSRGGPAFVERSTANPAPPAAASTAALQVAPVHASSTTVPAPTPPPSRAALAAGAASPAPRTAEVQPDQAVTSPGQMGGEATAEVQAAGPTPPLTALMPPVVDVSAAPPVATPETPAAAATPTRGAPAAAPAVTRGAPAASGPARERERSFVLDADLGTVKLHLDYIVYRSKDPFASINGQQVTIGSIIEGFTVEEIDLEVVRLRDSRGTVVLRAH